MQSTLHIHAKFWLTSMLIHDFRKVNRIRLLLDELTKIDRFTFPTDAKPRTERHNEIVFLLCRRWRNKVKRSKMQ